VARRQALGILRHLGELGTQLLVHGHGLAVGLLRLGVIRWPLGPQDRSQFALAETSARFRAAAVHRDLLVVTARTVQVRQRGFRLDYEFRRAADGLLICDAHHLFFYSQPTRAGRIAIGGRGAPYQLRRPISEEHENAPAVFERLRQTLRKHFPAAAEATITHHWGGPLAVPRDWSMGINFDAKTRFGSAGGYSGHGVAASNISGRTLADLVLGRDTDLVKLPWVGHEVRRWPPEPVRFIASRAIVELLGGADRYEDRTGKPAVQARLVQPFLAPR